MNNPLSRAGSVTSSRKLINGSLSVSLGISVLIILIVQVASIVLLVLLTRSDIRRQSTVTADEIAVILREPLYNVEDAQTVRIAETLVSSGRISGIRIQSTATGMVFDKVPDARSPWVEPQHRRIEFRDIHLGDLSIQYSDSEFLKTIRTFIYITLTLIIAVLFSNFTVFSFFILKRIRNVFGTIETGIHEIRSGNYTYTIDKSGYSDMDVIIDLLNDMSGSIRNKNAELLTLNTRLEERILKRTADLEAALAEQKILQDRLVEAGKLSVVGQLSAGIAHEFNTPLGAIISSNNSVIDYLDGDFLNHLTLFLAMNKQERELYTGVLAAGFAANRTINLPHYSRKQKGETAAALEESGIQDFDAIADILADIYILDKLKSITPLMGTGRDLEIISAAAAAITVRRSAEIICESGKKASTVVSALRSYLTAEKSIPQVVDVNEEINRVLTLMNNLLKHGVEITTELQPVHIRAVADKIDQVLLNIIRNAAQAMDFKGKMLISTATRDSRVWISIIDFGPGIPEEIQDRIFEPFFTTRTSGAGMGLGLDICRRIIEEANGMLTFTSRPGRTEFIINLPSYDIK